MRVMRFTATLLTLAALGWASSALAGGSPHVRLLRLEPRAVVRGTAFSSYEHLLVRLVGRGVSSKRIVADVNGAFRVTLRTPPARACGQYAVIVIRPVLKPVSIRIGPPECASAGPAGSSVEAVQQVPSLRTATSSRGHISVTLTVGELAPGLIEVGTGVKEGTRGSRLVSPVVLRERVTTQPDPETGVVAWRTGKTLPAGTYRVQVSALITEGVTSCFPRGTDCTQRWSNVRRVVVR